MFCISDLLTKIFNFGGIENWFRLFLKNILVQVHISGILKV
jgi:hypothetical protein